MKNFFCGVQTTFLFVLFLLGVYSCTVQAQTAYEMLYPGFEKIEESQAYHQFVLHETSELSKLIYLIDRFEHANVIIIYDGFQIAAAKAAPLARWFLQKNYRGQTAEEWIVQWCSRTVPRNKLIKVKLPDESVRLSRDILMDELKWLDQMTAVQEKQG